MMQRGGIPMIVIKAASDPHSMETVRELFREYQEALGVDLSFQHFDAELQSLPGDYAPPSGTLLIAEVAGETAGCVALRSLPGTHDCEMKRLYVRPSSRASGLGRRLAEQVITQARQLGYQRIYLDTLPSMMSAQHLYERLGFKDVPAYRPNPIAGSRFLCLVL
jgi:putative acetyltransferase